MSYATTTDLMIGDVQLSSTVDVAHWIETAADEMDEKLARLYVVPMTYVTDPTSAKTLTRVNAKIASGRLLLMANTGSKDLEAYAMMTLNEGLVELGELANGTTRLVGAERSGDVQGSLGPIVSNVDGYSANTAFEDFALVQHIPPQPPRLTPRWQPGQ